ncbi:MAG: hypothetical protein Q8J74_09380 [Candidatus Didemnitutus sp.]|nr:hypothetical protein [Candidatus Didemnitutus sp.]
MSVIPITVFFSLLLVGLFVVLFAREQHRQRFSSAERESLLPLADETPRVSGQPGDSGIAASAPLTPSSPVASRAPQPFPPSNVNAR